MLSSRRRPASLVIACALAVAFACAAPGGGSSGGAASASTPQSCGWVFRLSGDQVNAAFPDAAARYWITTLPVPPGFHIEAAGQFPHSRYISFITYDPASRAIDGIADYQIAPNAGSSNPFLPGARRTVKRRGYTVFVRNEVEPLDASGQPKPAQNTIYTEVPGQPTKTSRPTQTTTVVYRVYEADKGLDIAGGVGLPRLSLVADDGSQRRAVPDCPDHSLPSTQALTDGLAAAGSGPGSDSLPSTQLGGRNPPQWVRYTNAVNGLANGVLNNDRTGDTPAWPPVSAATNTLPSGGFYENVNNAYMTAFDSSSFGDVLVFHAQAPTTPRTYDGERTMGTGQLRYWSMCSNASTTQYLGCVKDDDVRLDANGYYTVVISTAANRPASARPGCGISWLPKGPLPSAPIILRNMLPAPGFAQAIQNAKQGSEEATLGAYYPRGYYFDHAANFDAWVAANGGCSGFTWPASVQTYRPPTLPATPALPAGL
jgi:hypothetical protein